MMLLSHQLRDRPHDTALTDKTGSATWQQLADRVDAWRRAFAGAGLAVGDTVAVYAGNRREAFEALLACLHSGLTAVPVNHLLTSVEVGHVLADSQARVLVTDEADAARADTYIPVLRMDLPLPGGPVPGPAHCGQLMVYTGGTTGAPKGVLNGLFATGDPYERVERMLGYAGKWLGVPDDGRVLLVGPWYHSAQLFFALMSLLRGSHLVIQGRFDAAETLEWLARHRITHSHLVPTQFVRMLRLEPEVREAFDPGDLRLVWHGAMACPEEVKRRMIDWWGPVLTEYYGASEGGAVTLISAEEWLARRGSVGRPIPPHRIHIVGVDGKPLPRGESGIVYIERPGRAFRYHNAPERTDAAFLRAGVFTYGEVGHLDDDGYLYLTGRAKDMIITGGVNVYPAEVEAVLLRHPSVRDAAVIGVPDEEFGERVVAIVELEKDPPLWAELDCHCRLTLAGFKVPRQYHAVASLPRQESGKVSKQALRELVEK